MRLTRADILRGTSAATAHGAGGKGAAGVGSKSSDGVTSGGGSVERLMTLRFLRYILPFSVVTR